MAGFVFLFLVVVVVPWGMWLLFCYGVSNKHGVEGLKAAPPIAKAFPITQWMAALRYVGPWLAELLGRNQPPPPPLPPGPDGPSPPDGPAP